MRKAGHEDLEVFVKCERSNLVGRGVVSGASAAGRNLEGAGRGMAVCIAGKEGVTVVAVMVHGVVVGGVRERAMRRVCAAAVA